MLRSVNWGNRFAAAEARAMLTDWRIPPLRALELLDVEHSDRAVRLHAIHILNELADNWLVSFVLQMTQAIKAELHHDSPLARFLLSRALRNTLAIGHSVYWHMVAELHDPATEERYGVILEEFLRGLPGVASVRGDLLDQSRLNRKLIQIATDVGKLPVGSGRPDDPDFRRLVLHNELRELNKTIPAHSRLPLSYRLEVRNLAIDGCRVMDSKKAPLLLWFRNAEDDADDVAVLFKVGDDIRQDQLTLQIIRLMDRLWSDAGLNLQLSPYYAISTGWMQGMLEIVRNSVTCAKITAEAGGAVAAFSRTPIRAWIKQNNPATCDFNKAIDNFTRSCAGYCVATYVLGIGDRHNDNIMVTRDGKLFHIDFGHFLGNFKSKFGFKRERAPFVFTPDFAFVIDGGKGRNSAEYKKFESYCCDAYAVLRENCDLFINLFLLMVSTGIPELTGKGDIMYIRDMLMPHLTHAEAMEDLRRQIKNCNQTRTTQVMNAIHIMKHR